MQRLAVGPRDRQRAGFLLGAPLCVVLLLMNDVRVFAALFFVVVFFFTWYNGPIAAVLFDVVPRGIAATVMGAYVFFIHIAGDAIALPVVGFLSDRYGLRVALMTLPAVGLLGGALLLLAGADGGARHGTRQAAAGGLRLLRIRAPRRGRRTAIRPPGRRPTPAPAPAARPRAAPPRSP